MKRFTVREMKNKALKNRYNGGFIVEKRNLRLIENEYALNGDEVSSNATKNPKEPITADYDSLDNNKNNDSIQQTVEYGAGTGNSTIEAAKKKVQQNPTLKTLSSQGKDIDVRFVNPNTIQHESVVYTKGELNKILFN